MKLLLTSGGLENKSIISALQELVNKPFTELNLAFISTAANVEEGDKWWLIKDLETCKKLGFKSVDIVDISALPKQLWEKRLKHSDVFFFEGGNTYHLMYWIKKSGLEKLLPELLKKRVYIGISAGSVVAGPSLILSSSEKEIVQEIGENIENEGLGLVNFIIEPHVNSTYFPELNFNFVKKEAEKAKYTVYALDDNSAIKVVDNKITVISEGVWKKIP